MNFKKVITLFGSLSFGLTMGSQVIACNDQTAYSPADDLPAGVNIQGTPYALNDHAFIYQRDIDNEGFLVDISNMNSIKITDLHIMLQDFYRLTDNTGIYQAAQPQVTAWYIDVTDPTMTATTKQELAIDISDFTFMSDGLGVAIGHDGFGYLINGSLASNKTEQFSSTIHVTHFVRLSATTGVFADATNPANQHYYGYDATQSSTNRVITLGQDAVDNQFWKINDTQAISASATPNQINIYTTTATNKIFTLTANTNFITNYGQVSDTLGLVQTTTALYLFDVTKINPNDATSMAPFTQTINMTLKSYTYLQTDLGLFVDSASNNLYFLNATNIAKPQFTQLLADVVSVQAISPNLAIVHLSGDSTTYLIKLNDNHTIKIYTLNETIGQVFAMNSDNFIYNDVTDQNIYLLPSNDLA